MKRKIAVITGSRSEYGILKPVMKELISNKNLKMYLIVTGMHLSKKHGYSIKEILNDGFFINYKFQMMPQGNTSYDMLKAFSKGIEQFGKIFKKVNPDIVLILGDRDEIFAAAIASSHMHIPLAHIHGGDRTKGGIDEYNRHAITKISNIHFAASKESFSRIIKLGEAPKFVFNTGSPSIDGIFQNDIPSKFEMQKKYGLLFTGQDVLLVFHPVTTEKQNGLKTIRNMLFVLKKLKLNVIAIAPNSDAGSFEIFKELSNFSNNYEHCKLFANLPRNDYLSLLQNCSILIGNSSSGMIEAGYFKIQVINIGIRQDKREHSTNVTNISNSKRLIQKELKRALNFKKPFKKSTIYGKGKASKKIVKILETIPLDKKLIQKQITY